MVPSTLPRAYYTSEEIFREEIERLFYERWVCVGRAERISQPGEYFVQPVGDESLLIIRGDDGVARAFYNVCRHRGSQLCTAADGLLQGAVRCPYHAWAYSFDGRLIGAPHMRGVPGFDAAAFSLYPAALETWEGFLFLSLAAEAEPVAAAYAPFRERLRPWGLAGLRSHGRIEYEVRANWKVIAENFSECYHCPLNHPELNELSDYRSGENDFTDGPFLGGYMTMNQPGTSLTLSGQRCGPTVGEVAGEDLNRVYYRSLFPNLLLGLHADYVLCLYLSPRSPELTHVLGEWLFHPDAVSQPDFRPEEGIGFWDRTNRQDWRICKITQQGIRSRAYTPGPACAGREDLVIAFHRQVLKALGHEGGSDE